MVKGDSLNGKWCKARLSLLPLFSRLTCIYFCRYTIRLFVETLQGTGLVPLFECCHILSLILSFFSKTDACCPMAPMFDSLYSAFSKWALFKEVRRGVFSWLSDYQSDGTPGTWCCHPSPWQHRWWLMGDDGWGRLFLAGNDHPFGVISVEGGVVSSAVSFSTSPPDEVACRRTVMCENSEQSWAQHSALWWSWAIHGTLQAGIRKMETAELKVKPKHLDLPLVVGCGTGYFRLDLNRTKSSTFTSTKFFPKTVFVNFR